jgi:hypothetical protein
LAVWEKYDPADQAALALHKMAAMRPEPQVMAAVAAAALWVGFD